MKIDCTICKFVADTYTIEYATISYLIGKFKYSWNGRKLGFAFDKIQHTQIGGAHTARVYDSMTTTIVKKNSR